MPNRANQGKITATATTASAVSTSDGHAIRTRTAEMEAVAGSVADGMTTQLPPRATIVSTCDYIAASRIVTGEASYTNVLQYDRSARGLPPALACALTIFSLCPGSAARQREYNHSQTRGRSYG